MPEDGQQNDDRQRDAQQPQQDASTKAHDGSPLGLVFAGKKTFNPIPSSIVRVLICGMVKSRTPIPPADKADSRQKKKPRRSGAFCKRGARGGWGGVSTGACLP